MYMLIRIFTLKKPPHPAAFAYWTHTWGRCLALLRGVPWPGHWWCLLYWGIPSLYRGWVLNIPLVRVLVLSCGVLCIRLLRRILVWIGLLCSRGDNHLIGWLSVHLTSWPLPCLKRIELKWCKHLHF